jgi:hypothetical protein
LSQSASSSSESDEDKSTAALVAKKRVAKLGVQRKKPDGDAADSKLKSTSQGPGAVVKQKAAKLKTTPDSEASKQKTKRSQKENKSDATAVKKPKLDLTFKPQPADATVRSASSPTALTGPMAGRVISGFKIPKRPRYFSPPANFLPKPTLTPAFALF